MYGLPSHLKALSAAEEQVLLAVWHCPPPVTSFKLTAALAENRWANTTLLSFLARLEQKGWLRHTRQDGCNVYHPTVTLRAYRVYVARERLHAVYGGSLADLLTAVLGEESFSGSQLEQARAVLQEKIDAEAEYDWYDPYG